MAAIKRKTLLTTNGCKLMKTMVSMVNISNERASEVPFKSTPPELIALDAPGSASTGSLAASGACGIGQTELCPGIDPVRVGAILLMVVSAIVVNQGIRKI